MPEGLFNPFDATANQGPFYTTGDDNSVSRNCDNGVTVEVHRCNAGELMRNALFTQLATILKSALPFV